MEPAATGCHSTCRSSPQRARYRDRRRVSPSASGSSSTSSKAASAPYLHLVDGGVSDNLGLRAVIDIVLGLEALRALNQKTALDALHRIVIFIVNSLSSPETNWDESENPPGILETLLKSTGVPIDRNSYEAVELLKDIAARWSTLRRIRDSPAFVVEKDRSLEEIVSGPDIELYIIDVSLAALDDKAEFDYLNNLSTTLALPDEAIDRLRAAARRIIVNSPDFRRLLEELGAHAVQK